LRGLGQFINSAKFDQEEVPKMRQIVNRHKKSFNQRL